MAYAELATLRPRAGGEYVYLREAYGPLAAFLTGWTSFVAGFSGAIAASAVALADFLGRFVPAAGDRTPLLSLPLRACRWSDAADPRRDCASSSRSRSCTSTRRAARCRTCWPGSRSRRCRVHRPRPHAGLGSFAHRGEHAVVPSPVTGWLLALVPVMFSYSGWNAAAYVAEEIRDPSATCRGRWRSGPRRDRHLPGAERRLPLRAADGDLSPLDGRLIDIAAERLFGFVAGNVLAVFTIVSIAASISAMVFAGPRVYYAMARDGLFLRGRARVHPRHRTPVAASSAQGVWSACWCCRGRCRSWSVHRVRDRAVCGGRRLRSSCCGAASPTRRGRSAPGAIRCARAFRA